MKTLLCCCLVVLFCCGRSFAQPYTPTALPMQDGYAIATCFSGDNTGQNPLGPTLVIMNVRGANTLTVPNYNWTNANLRYHAPGWISQNLGEIFGIATNVSGDIFLTSTVVYGGPTATTNYTFGPGGPGAVYKVNGVTGAISTFSTLPNQNDPANNIPYPALGNICYDSKHNQLFVTDLEDGKIYRLNGTTGAVLSKYDPFVADGGSKGFAPLGERIWGIGYFNDSVYFAQWSRDGGNPGGLPNAIWSVGLTATGDFTGALNGNGDHAGAEHKDFNIPANGTTGYSNPVSDIEFSQTGRMLLAERVWYGSLANPLQPLSGIGGWAHTARLLEYSLVGGVWTPFPTTKYKVGEFTGGFQGTNSAGGCDYGYETYDTVHSEIVNCDSAVWVSGDALHFLSFPLTYGFQRTPATGGDITNSILIDADGITNTGDKTQIGDIDIFKRCAVVAGCPLHAIKFVPIQGSAKNGCCYRLALTTASNVYTSLSAQVLTANVTFSGVTGPSGWGVGNTGTTATWTPTGGSIPAGTTDSLVLCMYSLVNPPVTVAFAWQNQDGTRCYDTISFDCVRLPPPVPPCVTLDSSTVTCKNQTANGYNFGWTFAVTNHSPFSAPPYNYPAQNMLISSATPGVSVSPSSASFPSILQGQTSIPINVAISGPAAVPGAQVCFVIQIHGAKLPNGDYVWCCPPDTICITLPKCKDCCDNFIIRIDGKPPVWNGTNVILQQSLFVAPGPVMNLTATVVSATQTAVCPGVVPVTHPIYGLIVGGILNSTPALLPAPTFTPATSTATWGTMASGAALAPGSIKLGFNFPAPPTTKGCFDTINFCVRYSFMDTACHTCEKTICYMVVRKANVFGHGGVWKGNDRFAGMDQTDPANPNSASGSDPSIQEFETIPSQLATIAMTSENAGVLTIAIPASNDPLDQITITELNIQGASGVVLSSLKDDATGTNAAIVDQVATLPVAIHNGEKRTFALSYTNSAQALTFDNLLRLRYVIGGSTDTGRSVVIVNARTPNGKGGDTLAVDPATKVSQAVRTYAVYVSNTNKTNTRISRVRVAVVGGGSLLAAGPFGDTASVILRTCLDGQNKLLLTPSSFAEDTMLMPSVTVKPIYLTISGATQNTVRIHYTTYDSLANIISEGDATLANPLSNVQRGQQPMSAQSSYLMPLYPNPASTSVTVQFHLRTDEQVSVIVTDARGAEVGRVVSSEQLTSGDHVFVFPIDQLPSGAYFITLHSPSATQTETLRVVR